MNRSSSLSVVKLRAAAAILVAVPALAAAGCGEKDEPPTTGPVVAQTTTGPVPAHLELAPPAPTGGTVHHPAHTPQPKSPAGKKTSPTIDRSFD